MDVPPAMSCVGAELAEVFAAEMGVENPVAFRQRALSGEISKEQTPSPQEASTQQTTEVDSVADEEVPRKPL